MVLWNVQMRLIMEENYILVVDDNPDAQEIFSVALKHMGYEVGVANDGREALASIKQRIPDMVLLDLMMPNMNGFEVLLRMQSSKRTQNIPVIIISAVANNSIKKLKGVVDVLPKAHYKMTDLQNTVTRVLAEHGPPRTNLAQ